MDLPRFRYRVDDADTLIWVDSWWLAFARENGAAELKEKAVLGRSLWDFVLGDETRQLYEEIHARLRSSGRPVVLPFRCDSPSLQRHLRMKITPEDAGQLLYECTLVHVQPQAYQSLLDPEQLRSDSFLTICSCCRQALLESSGWLEVEDISVRMQLFERPQVPQLRYTLCPRCRETMKVAMDDSG